MIIHEFEQMSDEWFAVRIGKFTASKALAIASNGKGLDTLCFEKAEEIISGKMKQVKQSFDMERGVEQEKLARMSYELATGKLVTTVGFVEMNSRVGASPDGLVGTDGLVEFKCPNFRTFYEFARTRKINNGYINQMQMQMLVTDRKWCDFVMFNENFKETIIIRVDRDEALIEKIRVGLEAGDIKLTEILEVVNEGK